MKTITLAVLILSTLTVFSQTKQEREVLKLSRDKFRWLVQKNSDSLNQVLEERLSYIHSNGWIQTKKELIEDLQSGKLTYNSITVVQDSIRLYTKSAVVTGRGKFVATLNGTTNTFDLAYTETYVLQKRTWKLVSRHASKVQ